MLSSLPPRGFASSSTAITQQLRCSFDVCMLHTSRNCTSSVAGSLLRAKSKFSAQKAHPRPHPAKGCRQGGEGGLQHRTNGAISHSSGSGATTKGSQPPVSSFSTRRLLELERARSLSSHFKSTHSHQIQGQQHTAPGSCAIEGLVGERGRQRSGIFAADGQGWQSETFIFRGSVGRKGVLESSGPCEPSWAGSSGQNKRRRKGIIFTRIFISTRHVLIPGGWGSVFSGYLRYLGYPDVSLSPSEKI